MKTLTYKKSGVNIKEADMFVKAISPMMKTDALSKVAAFGCPFNLGKALSGIKKPILVSSTDGVGTKLLIAQQFNMHTSVGIDCVAMNVNDVICLGAKPLFFLDYIACGKVKPKILKRVVSGIHKGVSESGCVLIGGETAEMPGMYAHDEYDLAGFCSGIVDRDKIINGSNMEPGDCVIGLASSGLHSNGYSLARKALGPGLVKKYVQELLTPTRIYVKPILSLIKILNQKDSAVKAVAHITGGAFYKKAIKIVPDGLGMDVNRGSWPEPKLFSVISKAGSITSEEMFTVFNMGLGMLVVVSPARKNKAINIVKSFGIDAWHVGEIVKSSIKFHLHRGA